MRYIIMCGSSYKPERHLSMINGETILARTVRLLVENGVDKKDIRLTPSIALKNILTKSKLPAGIILFNNYTHSMWIDGFYPLMQPCTYLFGDVVFSPEAIRKIVETETDRVEFFASAPPFDARYSRAWAEPFAFKVVNQEAFRCAINKVIDLHLNHHAFRRPPIAWELWQVIKDTPINEIDYTNYTVINDYTCDVDEPDDILKFEGGSKWPIT